MDPILEITYVDVDSLDGVGVYDNSHIEEEAEEIARNNRERRKRHPKRAFELKSPSPLREAKCPDLSSLNI